jgi:outer membrane protein OmpA-like peptidoglycan-associated protein
MDDILHAGCISGYQLRRQTGRVQPMALFENGRQPRRGRAVIQGWLVPATVPRARVDPALVLLLIGLACIGGCSDYHHKGPEAWYHDSIGGKIAAERPPPPGENDPFPNLATVPPRPAKPNTSEWNQMTAGLATDRLKALQTAAIAPIPNATPGAASSASFIPGAQTQPAQPPPGQEPGASAALVGASPPPAGPAPAAKPSVPLAAAGAAVTTPPAAAPGPVPATAAGAPAPVPPAATPDYNLPSSTTSPPGGIASAAADAQTAVPMEVPPPLPPPLTIAAAAQRVANGQLPPLPTEEPARPAIAPAPPPPPVPVTAAPPIAPSQARGTDVDFDRGSTKLSDTALADVRALAAMRGDHGIAVTGYGDATSSDPLAQSDAIGLGLSRAQALATALVARGVPYAMLRLNAESAGRGANLRLLQ